MTFTAQIGVPAVALSGFLRSAAVQIHGGQRAGGARDPASSK